MSPIVHHLVYAGVRIGIRALTYRLARRFRAAQGDDRLGLLAEAWRELAVPEDGAALPDPEDLPVALLDRAVALSTDVPDDFFAPPPAPSGSGASASSRTTPPPRPATSAATC